MTSSPQTFSRCVTPARGAVMLLVACLWAAPAAGYSILHNFTGGSDGANPQATLISDGAGTLYGTAFEAGAFGGTVFKIAADGSDFEVLHTFTIDDGAGPRGELIFDGAGNLYGTASGGGPSFAGVVFRMAPDRTGYTILHGFGGPGDGVNPYGSLVMDGAGNLYGTTLHGGSSNNGTVYMLASDGSAYAILHEFGSYPDASTPEAGLVLDDAGNLYGTTYYGGTSMLGAVFKIATDGSGYAILHNFVGEGLYPSAPLAWGGAGHLYGTTQYGPPSAFGLVFTLATDGSGYGIVTVFGGPPNDGSLPAAAPLLDGAGNIYGTTAFGGSGMGAGNGILYTVAIDGSGYTVLQYFSGQPSDGANPNAAVILDAAGNLYGTTSSGGSANRGTIFSWP